MRRNLPLLSHKNTVHLGEFDYLSEFVELLAIPHLVSHLISIDYSCSVENAYHLYWLSEPYGAMEFPISLPCPALEDLAEEPSISELDIVPEPLALKLRLR